MAVEADGKVRGQVGGRVGALRAWAVWTGQCVGGTVCGQGSVWTGRCGRDSVWAGQCVDGAVCGRDSV